jgi:hypothetical protein
MIFFIVKITKQNINYMKLKIMKRFLLFAIFACLPTHVFAFSFDGDWYGTNPCAYFDKSQDVKLVITEGKAKVDWGDEFKPTKYRGKVLKNNKLGLNSNEGRIEGEFISEEELVLNKGKEFTNTDGEITNCEFTLNKGAMKEEETPDVVVEEKTPEEKAAEEEEKTITEVEENIENIPDWFETPPDGGKIALYSVGVWESPKLTTAKLFAEQQALEALGRTIESRVGQEINTMIDEVGLNDDVTLNYEMTSVGTTTVKLATTTGYKIDKQITVPKGKKYVVYVLLKLRFSVVNNILIDQIKKTDTSEVKLKASKAFQDLEEEFNKTS